MVATLLSGHNQGDIAYAISTNPQARRSAALKRGGLISPAAISVRKEGPVNWRWAIGDFRIAMLELWILANAPEGQGPRRRSLRPINAGETPLLVAPSPRIRCHGALVRIRGGVKSPLATRSVRKGPAKWRGIPAISAGRWGSRQVGAAPRDPLSVP